MTGVGGEPLVTKTVEHRYCNLGLIFVFILLTLLEIIYFSDKLTTSCFGSVPINRAK